MFPAARPDRSTATSLLLLALLAAPACGQRAGAARTAAACPDSNSGLVVPDGFCATVVADGIRGPRQLTVGPDGTVYAATHSGVEAWRDTTGDGRPDAHAVFGSAGNDVALRQGWLYLALSDRIVRWRLPEGALAPSGEPETVVSGLPTGGHSAKSLVFSGDTMFVNFGSGTNSCQEQDRTDRSPGISPCAELERRAGIWAFPAGRTGLTAGDGSRYATGLRNAEAIAVQPGTGQLWMAVNGRDQLSDNWGFDDQYNAENPAEEFGPVRRGSDYGWPYCYYSVTDSAKVLAPEYGGDGKKVGRCADAAKPSIAFPAHWAPLALTFYQADAFGPDYRGGAFIAFHGSWNRAPLPQAGYRVVFVPFADGHPTGRYSTFATGSGGPTSLRASGVAVGPDGALYIAADANGKIWRVTRR